MINPGCEDSERTSHELFILGGTGATGRELLIQALQAGHDGTALVRDPTGLGDVARRVRIVTADATSERDLTAALPGHAAIVSALGSGKSSSPPSPRARPSL